MKALKTGELVVIKIPSLAEDVCMGSSDRHRTRCFLRLGHEKWERIPGIIVFQSDPGKRGVVLQAVACYESDAVALQFFFLEKLCKRCAPCLEGWLSPMRVPDPETLPRVDGCEALNEFHKDRFIIGNMAADIDGDVGQNFSDDGICFDQAFKIRHDRGDADPVPFV